MFRYTRQTLRVYWEKGLMSWPIPARLPEDVPVTFQTSFEEALYDVQGLAQFGVHPAAQFAQDFLQTPAGHRSVSGVQHFLQVHLRPAVGGHRPVAADYVERRSEGA